MPEQRASKPSPNTAERESSSASGQCPDNGSVWYDSLTRRDFLKKAIKGGAILAGSSAAVAAGKAVADKLVPPGQTEQTRSPEINQSDIEFGFNTHPFDFNLDKFKEDVDTLTSNGQSWIRFNLINNGVVGKDQNGSVTFTDNIAFYDQAIEYAKQKGLKIALATNVPDSLATLPISDYVPAAVAYYSELAQRYKGKVDTWQIFNEADTHHFRDYHDISAGTEANYLGDLARVVSASAEAIHILDPNSKVTMNASLWAPNRGVVRERTSRFFDAVQGSLDFLSLDPYPDVYDPASAQTIPSDIEFFQKKYNKDIVVAEIGVSARDIPDNQKRAQVLLGQLSAIKGGNVKPKAVFIYEMRNEPNNPDPREASFGTEEILPQLAEQMQSPRSQSSVAKPTA